MYNCTFIKMNELMPIEERRNVAYGIVIGLLAFIFVWLYLFCLYALTRREVRDKSCYKIMIMLAIYDLITLPTTGLVAAYQSISGVTFCDAPITFYVIGMFTLGAWMGYTYATVILALNRVFFTSRIREYFDGTYIYGWLCVPLFFSLYAMWSFHPAIYTPIVGGYIFNPFTGVLDVGDDHSYDNPQHTVSNFAFIMGLPSIYLYFYLKNKYFLKKGMSAGNSTGNTERERSLFIQCVLLSSLVCAATVGYTLMQIMPVPTWYICLSHFLWVVMQGCPPIIFLTMNKTIRNILWRSISPKNLSTVGPASNSHGSTAKVSIRK
ncbi:unnamed protein product [Bursaphelenchus xylophilus]|uniref:(pine wood nematode) hypothetical protein n=1 Tax=Bursaphelenchus xylophilus TaxID=6326 RepID=A0A1I7SRZ3_BURXY|nr:unnamed protein product [Bursaphelenchus xylophilus]CAG9101684.1 unnamed protein product [Bursaphelenchus xylophilus]